MNTHEFVVNRCSAFVWGYVSGYQNHVSQLRNNAGLGELGPSCNFKCIETVPRGGAYAVAHVHQCRAELHIQICRFGSHCRRSVIDQRISRVELKTPENVQWLRQNICQSRHALRRLSWSLLRP